MNWVQKMFHTGKQQKRHQYVLKKATLLFLTYKLYISIHFWKAYTIRMSDMAKRDTILRVGKIPIGCNIKKNTYFVILIYLGHHFLPKCADQN